MTPVAVTFEAMSLTPSMVTTSTVPDGVFSSVMLSRIFASLKTEA